MVLRLLSVNKKGIIASKLREDCITFSFSRAPTDCVQYFTGISGEVKSFNFDGGIQLRDIQYTICIRRETGSCGIQYTVQDNTTPDSYDLSDASANANVSSFLFFVDFKVCWIQVGSMVCRSDFWQF